MEARQNGRAPKGRPNILIKSLEIESNKLTQPIPRCSLTLITMRKKALDNKINFKFQRTSLLLSTLNKISSNQYWLKEQIAPKNYNCLRSSNRCRKWKQVKNLKIWLLCSQNAHNYFTRTLEFFRTKAMLTGISSKMIMETTKIHHFWHLLTKRVTRFKKQTQTLIQIALIKRNKAIPMETPKKEMKKQTNESISSREREHHSLDTMKCQRR